MKKTYLSIWFFFSIATACFGQSALPQSNSPQARSFGPGKLNIGIDGAVITGGYKDTYTGGIGGSLKYEMPLNQNFYGTLSLGYEAILVKSDSTSAGYKSSYSFFPEKIGLKYCINGHYFIEGQAGILLPAQAKSNNSTVSENIVETTFLYAIGIGYTMPKGIEVGLRYESWDEGVAFNQIALRLAYRF